jgi:hypothetical protein
MIARWFNKLVDKDDYDPKDKRKILAHLTNLSNCAEDNVFLAQKCLRTRV